MASEDSFFFLGGQMGAFIASLAGDGTVNPSDTSSTAGWGKNEPARFAASSLTRENRLYQTHEYRRLSQMNRPGSPSPL